MGTLSIRLGSFYYVSEGVEYEILELGVNWNTTRIIVLVVHFLKKTEYSSTLLLLAE
jgi:hypothetical protein